MSDTQRGIALQSEYKAGCLFSTHSHTYYIISNIFIYYIYRYMYIYIDRRSAHNNAAHTVNTWDSQSFLNLPSGRLGDDKQCFFSM